MGKAVKKIAKTVSKVTRSKFLDPLGVSKSISLSPVEDVLSGRSPDIMSALSPGMAGGTDASGSEDSALASALSSQAQATRNANVDLSLDNTPTIDIGGTAEQLADAGSTKRKRRTGGLSTALGINVG